MVRSVEGYRMFLLGIETLYYCTVFAPKSQLQNVPFTTSRLSYTPFVHLGSQPCHGVKRPHTLFLRKE